MSWGETQDLARLAYAEARFTTASGFARANCPFCITVVGKEDRKQCFAVDTRTGFFKCWRCGTKGKLDDVADLASEAAPPEKKIESVVEPPEGYMELGAEPGLSAVCTEEARDYLCRRGLTNRGIWAAARIGCCLDGRFGGRIVVPVTAAAGCWLGWVGRVWRKTSDRPYMNAPGMNLGMMGHLYNEVVLSRSDPTPVMVMEGVFDALPYWTDAVAVLGKPTEPQVMTLVRSARPVVMVLDGDAWEEAWALAMRLRFEGQRAGMVKLPPKVDPDEVDRAWLRCAAQAALEEAL